MSSTDWPFTLLGRKFFDGQLPELTRNIGRVASELKRHNDASENLAQLEVAQVIKEMEAFDLESFEQEHTDVGEVWRNLLRWKNMLQRSAGLPLTGDAESQALEKEDG